MAKKESKIDSANLIILNWKKYRRYHGLDADQQYVYDESSFSELETDKERIQKRPTMYIPSMDIEGVYHVIFENFDNHTDEVTAKGTCGDTVTLIYDIATHEFTTSDNGRGVPHGMLLKALTRINVGAKMGNSENTAYQESGGTNGVGYKLTAFLTEYLKVCTRRDGLESRIEFLYGDVVEDSTIKTKQKSGTTNVFKFTKKYFPKFKEVDTEHIRKIIEQKSFIHPHIKFNFIVLKDGKEVESFRYHNRDISDWMKQQKPDTQIMRFKGEAIHSKMKKTGKMDFVFAYREDLVDIPDENLQFSVSYANGIRTVLGGRHLDGARNALSKYFRKHISEKVFTKKEKETLNIIPSDILNGLVCFIDVRLNEPVFRAQHKDRLEVEWVGKLVEEFVYKSLVEAKDKEIANISTFIKNVVKARNESKKIRTVKNVGNPFSADRIKKYVPLLNSIHTTWPELHLVEGDSARGNLEPILDPYNQAVYQVTGKPDNYVDATPAEIMNDKGRGATRDIYNILGIYPGKPCDPKSLPFTKCIMDMDGDTDGDDMLNTVLSTFAIHNPELIEAGFFYRSIIPLYSFTELGRKIYLPTQKHLVRFILNKFLNAHTLYLGKKELESDDIFQLTFDNYKYNEVVKTIADSYHISPLVIEAIAQAYSTENHSDIEYWSAWAKRNLEANINVRMDKGHIVMSGIHGADGVFLPFDRPFAKKLKRIKKKQDINKAIYGYRLDDQKESLSLYQVMKVVHKYTPKDIERYKGVGEFESEDLRINCFDPKTRVLMQIKFSDKKENDIAKVMLFKSDKKGNKEARGLYLQNVDASDIEIDT